MHESVVDINYLFGTSLQLQQQVKLYVLLGLGLPTTGTVDNVLTNSGHKSFYSLGTKYIPGEQRRQQPFKISRYMAVGIDDFF